MKLCRVTEFMKDTLSSETLAAISNRANKLTQSINRHTTLVPYWPHLVFFSSQLPSSPSLNSISQKKAEQKQQHGNNQTTTR